jgi:hypothetical protein
MRKAQEMSLKRWGLKAEAVSKGHISKQDLGWVPLAPATLTKKITADPKQSENILIATSTYFQSITSWVTDDTAWAGVRRGVRTKDGEVELGLLAAVHEFGSDDGRIPARPLWKPTFEETTVWHAKNNQPVMHFANLLSKY